MVLILAGNSENVAHAWKKIYERSNQMPLTE